MPNTFDIPISADEIYRGVNMLGAEAFPLSFTRIYIDASGKPILQRQWASRVGKIWLEIPR